MRPSPAVAVAVGAALLVSLALGLTLAREGEFESTVRIGGTPANTEPPVATLLPPAERGYARRLLGETDTRAGIAAAADFLVAEREVAERVSVVRGEGVEVLVSARADTPERAAGLADTAGEQLVAASSRDVGASSERRLADLEAELDGARGRARRRLEADAETLERTVERPPSRLFVVGPAAAPEPGGLDSLVDALPGSFPPRPDLLAVLAAALVAGLGAGAALLARR